MDNGNPIESQPAGAGILENYFGDNDPPATETQQQANPEGEPEKTAAPETPADGSSVENADEAVKSDEEPDQGEPQAETTTPPPQKWTVAGREYDSFEEATKAVNRINGDNSRLAGENSRLSEDLTRLSEENARLKSQGDQGFEETDEELDPTDPKTIEKIVDQRLTKIQLEQQEKERQRTAKEQIDNLEKEADYEEVYPTFEKMVTTLGEAARKFQPVDLYQMARGEVMVKKGAPAASTPAPLPESLDKIADQRAAKAVAKKNATKVAGGSSQANSPVEKEPISPILENYFNQK